MAVKQSGSSMIEMVIAIMIVGIALRSIAGAFTLTGSNVVGPMVRQQAMSLAEAYLDEITSLAYAEPESAVTEMYTQSESETRRDYDDVFDYNDLVDAVPQDRDGADIDHLSHFRVSVVTTEIQHLFGTSETGAEIVVTVSPIGSSENQFILSGYVAQ